MTGILSYVPVVNRLVSSSAKPQAIPLEPVEVHHVETNPDKRARCLKHLLKANHVNYAIVYHNLQFDNHNAHILSSAYLLGANENQLHDIYDKESRELEPWRPSPAEVVDEDWMDFRGDRRYQRAFVDFFEDKLVMEFSYDWKKVLNHYLFLGKEPLAHGLIGGLGHPLIHLGYAYEMDCKEIAMEAIALSCVQYDFLHKYLDNSSYTKPVSSSATPLELLVKISEDSRFEKLGRHPDFYDLEKIMDENEDLFMEYWNAWNIDDPLKQFELSQQAAVALLVATVRPGAQNYNFVLVHLLTSSHAIRILLPNFPAEYHVNIVREWWLLVIALFVLKGRPKPDFDNIKMELNGKSWKYVEDKAVNSPWRTDAHFVKGARAMKEAAKTWGDDDGRYLAAAVTFVDNFKGWSF